MGYRRTIRDTYNYDLVGRNGRVLYRGITNDPERREQQHKSAGRRFRYLRYESFPCSRETARKRERGSIANFESGHGRKPRYNRVL